MKSIIACLIISVAVVGVQTVEKSKTSLASEYLRGKVKSYTEYKYRAKDSAGVVLRKDSLQKEIHYFNVEGNKISKEASYLDSKIFDVSTYEYDKNNNQINFVRKRKSDGGVIESGTSTYDERNNVVTYYYVLLNTQQTVRNEYTYDSSGKIVTHKNYNSKKEGLNWFFRYTYNKSNRMLSKGRYSPDELLDEVIQYDSLEREVRKEIYVEGVYVSEFQYKYDDKNNLTSLTIASGDEVSYVSDYRYEKYDAKGNWGRKVQRGNGKALYIYERTYLYY